MSGSYVIESLLLSIALLNVELLPEIMHDYREYLFNQFQIFRGICRKQITTIDTVKSEKDSDNEREITIKM